MNALGSAIYGTLTADATLIGYLGGTAIYDTLAVQGTVVPYLTFNQQRTTAYPTFGVNPAYEKYPITITCWAMTHTAGTVDTILSRVKTLLNNANLTVAGHSLMVCQYRAAGPVQPAFIQGAVHRSQTHYYDIEVQ